MTVTRSNWPGISYGIMSISRTVAIAARVVMGANNDTVKKS